MYMYNVTFVLLRQPIQKIESFGPLSIFSAAESAFRMEKKKKKNAENHCFGLLEL